LPDEGFRVQLDETRGDGVDTSADTF